MPSRISKPTRLLRFDRDRRVRCLRHGSATLPSQVASAQAATVPIAPQQDAHMAIYPGGCHGCCLAACLGCGKRPKVSSQATCLDLVEVAIHSYRHRYGAAESDPAFEPIEAELVKQPVITVPTIVLHGDSDGVSPPRSSERHDRFFTGPYQRRVVPVAGHFLPREAPEAVVQAVRELGSN
jgi:hypothetical protein